MRRQTHAGTGDAGGNRCAVGQDEGQKVKGRVEDRLSPALYFTRSVLIGYTTLPSIIGTEVNRGAIRAYKTQVPAHV
ncbi:MAG: hypothetical protein IDH49_07880 [Gammaproteobacteria bacterium]|nr:hypothetical protein [Gammaproteobacteria bacterium]